MCTATPAKRRYVRGVAALNVPALASKPDWHKFSHNQAPLAAIAPLAGGTVVTADARGFGEVREATRVAIVSHSAPDDALEFQTASALFSALTGHGLDPGLPLGAEGAWWCCAGSIHRRWP